MGKNVNILYNLIFVGLGKSFVFISKVIEVIISLKNKAKRI